ncbi:hypothetical protein JXL19_09065 [bacterium]|nr:hypothetical protein [bacterium]
MDPEKIVNSLFEELNNELKAMAKAKTIEEKIQYSQIVNNLSESLGVFLNVASDMMSLDLED